MQLTYRGVAYSPPATAHFNFSAKTVVGKYRGVTCSIRQDSSVNQLGRINLRYRGAYAYYYPDSVYPTNPGLAAI